MPDVGFTPIEQPKKPSILDIARANKATENETAIARDPTLAQSVIAEKTGVQPPAAPTTPSILDATRANRAESIQKAIAEDPALTFSPIAEKKGQETPLPPEPSVPVAAIPPVGKKAENVAVQPSVQDMVRKLSLSGGAGQASLNRGPADVKAIAAEAVKNPSFADMLRSIGFNVANIVQSAAYGATGNTKPTIGDVAQSQAFEMKKAKAQSEIAAQMNAIEQKYMMERIQAQSEYQAAANKDMAKIALDNKLVEIEAERKKDISVLQSNPLFGIQKAGVQAGAINKSLGNLGLGGQG